MGELLWRKSPWDGNVHAFRELGEIASEAICEHSALTSRLQTPTNRDRKCHACLLLHGLELSEKHGDADRYAI
jgi:hypothetical protein